MMQHREINVDHVRLAIREPECTKAVLRGRVKVCKPLESGNAITVVYYKDGFRDRNDFIVVTAYYKSRC